MNEKDNYQNLLKDSRWIERRNEILTRDKNTCQMCGARDRYIHVHHIKYWDGFLPWEYPDYMLVSLCDECHYAIHKDYVESLDGIKVGDIYGRWHSDYHNTGIVYAIDSRRRLVYTLESDDGVSFNEVYDECNIVSRFKRNYWNESCAYQQNWLFTDWFLYVSQHIEDMPFMFRINYNSILNNNSTLREIINNHKIYENG